jgi:hypothetical protein
LQHLDVVETGPVGDAMMDELVGEQDEPTVELAFIRQFMELEQAARQVMSEMGLSGESVRRVLEGLLGGALVLPDSEDRETLTRLIAAELTIPKG